jgi:uncharacterized protein
MSGHIMNTFLTRRLVLALVILAAANAARAVEPIHALLIAGGCCHDYEAQKTILTEGISARANVTWDILVEDTTRNHRMSIYEKPDWSKGYDVVVHDECFGDVTNVDFIEHIAKAHFDGVPAVVIHCAIHSYRHSTTDEWRKLLGVSSFYHDPARKFEVKNLETGHPVMKGFPALWEDPAPDELYRLAKLWPNCVPLAKTIAATNTPDTTCIWVNTYGKARVFGTTLGHANATVQSSAYLDLVTRGLLWACGKLDDDGQPKAGYGKASAPEK